MATFSKKAMTGSLLPSECPEGDGELCVDTFWLPSTNNSPLLESTPTISLANSTSLIGSGSRLLRPGDWRLVAAAETGGGPVQPPSAASHRYPLDNTPNIDDVHSPASSIHAMSPAFSRKTVSPLRPRVLNSSSISNAPAAGTPSLSTASAKKPEDCPGSTVTAGSLSTGEVSFRWESPPRGPRPHPASPMASTPGFAPSFIGSDGELSTPGSVGYNSPCIAGARPVSIMRSSVQNPLFVDRPPPSEGGDPVAKTLLLSPYEDMSPKPTPGRNALDSDWSSPSSAEVRAVQGSATERSPIAPSPTRLVSKATPAATPVQAQRPTGSAPEPPSPLLMPLAELLGDTPRRNIKGLSAILSGAAAPANTAMAAKEGQGDMSATQPADRSSAGFKTAAAEASVSVPPAVGVALDLQAADSAAFATPPASPGGLYGANGLSATLTTSPEAAGKSGVARQLDLDDVGACRRGFDQTPKKANKANDSKDNVAKTPEAKASVGSYQATSQQPQQSANCQRVTGSKAQGIATTGSAVNAQRSRSPVLSSSLFLLVVLLATLGGITIHQGTTRSNPLSGASSAVCNTGPVCFRERYPLEHRNWYAVAQGVAAAEALSVQTADSLCTTISGDANGRDATLRSSSSLAGPTEPTVGKATNAPMEGVPDGSMTEELAYGMPASRALEAPVPEEDALEATAPGAGQGAQPSLAPSPHVPIADTTQAPTAGATETPMSAPAEAPRALTAEAPDVDMAEAPDAEAAETPDAHAAEMPGAKPIEAPVASAAEASCDNVAEPDAKAAEAPNANTAEAPSDDVAEALFASLVEAPGAKAAETPDADAVEAPDADAAEAPDANAAEMPEANAAEATDALAAEVLPAYEAEAPVVLTDDAPALRVPDVDAVETLAVEVAEAHAAEAPSAQVADALAPTAYKADAVEAFAADWVGTPEALVGETSAAEITTAGTASALHAAAVEVSMAPVAVAREAPPAEVPGVTQQAEMPQAPAQAQDAALASAVEAADDLIGSPEVHVIEALAAEGTVAPDATATTEAHAEVAVKADASAVASAHGPSHAPIPPRQLLGWRLRDIVVGCTVATAAGAAFAILVEVMGSRFPHPGAAVATAPEPEPKPTPACRILRLKTGDAPSQTPAEDKARPDASPAAGQGQGSFVWMQNRLVYIEGDTSELK